MKQTANSKNDNLKYHSIPIQINISDQMVKSSGFIKHTEYIIEGRDHFGNFTVFKRYSDFYELRKVLIKQWPGCYIPPIPEKLSGNGNDYDVVRLRKKLLNTFLQILSQIEFIYYSKEVYQEFLRSIHDVIKNYSIQKQNLPEAQMIYNRMKEVYNNNIQLKDQDDNLEFETKITKFQKQLNKQQNILKEFIKQAKILSQPIKQFNEEKKLIYLQLLPNLITIQQMWAHPEKYKQIEQGIQNKQIQPNRESDQMTQLLETLNKNYTNYNPIINITDYLEFDIQNIAAMQQCLDYRDNLIHQQKEWDQYLKRVQIQNPYLRGSYEKVPNYPEFQNEWNHVYHMRIKMDYQQLLIQILPPLIAEQEICCYRINKSELYFKMLSETQQQERQIRETENLFLKMLKEQAQSQQ